MVQKTKPTKEKKIVFSEKIDDAINGYAIGLSFILISLFLFWQDEYLLSKLATRIVGTIVGLFGLCSCSMQLSQSTKIKGFDTLSIGLVFFVLWLICYLRFNTFTLNLLLTSAFILGVYGIVRGVMELSYSFITSVLLPKKEKSKTTRSKEIFLFITQLFGLALTILNILEIFGLVGS